MKKTIATLTDLVGWADTDGLRQLMIHSLRMRRLLIATLNQFRNSLWRLIRQPAPTKIPPLLCFENPQGAARGHARSGAARSADASHCANGARPRREEGGEIDRGEMRERMRQRREQMMANRDPVQGGQRPRGRMGAQSDWWQDETIRGALALDDSQIQALDTRRGTLETRKLEARQQLATSQRELMNALESVDRERISSLIDQRSSAYQELQQAELDWWRTLLDQLNDEQLATLAQQYPHLLR